jgi:hypothetical protein
MPAPQIGDSSNNLLAKILQNLGGTPSVGDGKLNLLRKIAEAYGATTNRSDSSWMLLSRIVATGANKPSVSDSEYNLLYKFALNTGVSPFRGDGKYNILYRICQQTIPPVYDEDAVAFAEASGATDIANLSAFVTGVKDLGLWDSMVCWPLRSSQNAGTGTTAYSLGGLGTYNGTLVNGPTWGVDGVEFTDESTDHIATGYTPAKEDHLFFAVMEANPQGTNFNVIASTRGSPAATGGYTYAQNWTGVWRSVLWASGGPLDNTGDAAITDGSFHSAAFRTRIFSPTPAYADLSIDGGAYDVLPGAITQDDPSELLLGNETTTDSRALGGALSFAGYFQRAYSGGDTVNASLHKLLRETLCQGLGLP